MRPSAVRQTCHVCTTARVRDTGLVLVRCKPSGGDAMEQRLQQVLDAARAQLDQRNLDRSLAAQRGVAGGQEHPRIVDVFPHMWLAPDQ